MDLYTRAEAARILRIGLRTLDRRIADGELGCHRFGDGPRPQVRISEEQIQAYLEATTAAVPDSLRRRAKAILVSAPRRSGRTA